MQTIEANPKKLKSGAWGALAKTESVRTGDTLQITTRAGKSWTATVRKVLWSGNGVAICATASSGGSTPSALERYRAGDMYHGTQYEGQACGFPCPVDGHRCTPSNPCHDCM